jgi:hypothetical protein
LIEDCRDRWSAEDGRDERTDMHAADARTAEIELATTDATGGDSTAGSSAIDAPPSVISGVVPRYEMLVAIFVRSYFFFPVRLTSDGVLMA